MSVVVPFLGFRIERRFQLSRQSMLRDLTAWLETNPPADDVEQEISGNIAASRQLQLLLQL